jgi:hypothetical protein
MQTSHEPITLILCLFLSCLLSVTTATTSTNVSRALQTTCRPVNYILDSLPRQCPLLPGPSTSGDKSARPTGDSSLVSASSAFVLPYVNQDAFLEVSGEKTDFISKIQQSVTSETKPVVPLITAEPVETEAVQKPAVPSVVDLHSTEEGFLSFEDWKRLNLIRSSEKADDKEQGEPTNNFRQAPQPRGQHGDQSVDSVGDDIEIQIGSTHYGQTSKERFNYASFDCAAAVLKANPEAKGSSSILDENQDRYMLNKCSASNKFVIVEMCEDILVDTIVLANLEFFSSTFKDFAVSISDRYPIQEREWKTLGTFTANNTRALQVFAIKNPLIWARYLRIEFLNHFGNEFYCPLTLLRVHGTTMMEEYKNQENINPPTKPRQDLKEESATVIGDIATTNSGTDADSQSVDVAANSLSPLLCGTIETRTENSITTMLQPTGTAQTGNSTQVLSESVSSSNASFSVDEYSIEEYEAIPTDHIQNRLESNSRTFETLDPSSRIAISEKSTDRIPMKSVDDDTSSEKESQIAMSSAVPATQESVYKTITKRLSLLEANATLSLRYIEEQSQLLRDVFSKMERRHAQKIDFFLTELNNTLVNRLSGFVKLYDWYYLISAPTI